MTWIELARAAAWGTALSAAALFVWCIDDPTIKRWRAPAIVALMGLTAFLMALANSPVPSC